MEKEELYLPTIARSTIRSPLLILEFPSSSFLRNYLPNEAAGFAALLFCGLWLCEERKGKEGFEKKTFSCSSTGVQYNDTKVHTFITDAYLNTT